LADGMRTPQWPRRRAGPSGGKRSRMARGDVLRRTVKDQFAHGLACRGRVQRAPHTVASRYVRTVNTRNGADEGKTVFADVARSNLYRFGPLSLVGMTATTMGSPQE
jgi:hypothetical protein